MIRILSQRFFQSRDTVKIARSLLGKFLVRRFPKGQTNCSSNLFDPCQSAQSAQSAQSVSSPRRSAPYEAAMMITEVEAYGGFKDRASHAHRGKTERNKIMFGKAGHWYVYFTYGMHYMLNIVTGPEHYPAAILIRSVIQLSRHGGITGYLNGPAKLTKVLRIDKKLNGKPTNKKSGLWIEDRGVKIPIDKIKKAPRIGVAYAGPKWSKKKWRFYLI